jgi:DeoR/GlpR family transcriptional regulator of sugar metabolism
MSSPVSRPAAQRRASIAAYLLQHRWATVRELAAATGVSLTTVRRDLDLLAAGGELIRVHGGAGALSADSTATLRSGASRTNDGRTAPQ